MPASKTTPPPAGMPSAEDQAKLQAVASAGASAAAQEPDPEQATVAAKEAMKDERDRQGLKMSDQELDQIADLFVSKTIAKFEERGAFDPVPEPVAPVEAPPAPGAEQAAGAAADASAEPDPSPVPQRTTFAQRFMGIG